MNKVAIIGAGAMGGLFGAMLSEAGTDTVLIDVWAEHVAAMQKNGLSVVDSDGHTATVKVSATTSPADIKHADLIIIFVKSYNTAGIAEVCSDFIRPDAVVLTMQNGLGNAEILMNALGADKVIAGSTSFGCTMLGPGRIKRVNSGKVTIGELNGCITRRLTEVQQLFNRAGINTEISSNIDGLIWTKLTVNCGINALTAITGLKNGQLLENEETSSLLARAVEEAVRVARCKNITLLTDNPVEYVRGIAASTYHNKSSMLQDIERGKQTEIDFINGAVVTQGSKLGVDTPVNEVLTKLVKTLEKRKYEKE